MHVIECYAVYITLSIAVTVWVGRTLFKNGRVFLVDAMRGREDLADSVNHLLIVGFYLVNVGYVALALRFGVKPNTAVEAVEFVSTKTGLVLLMLGVMHFFNLYVLSRFRRWGGSLTEPHPTEPTPENGLENGPTPP
jgi:hypothetical protein